MTNSVPLTTSGNSEGAQAILVAANQLFAEHGFDGVSINDVAVAAGVSKANIFHHFGTKQNLYLAVLKSAFTEFQSLMGHLAPGKATLNERLGQFSNAHLEQMTGCPQSVRLVLRELLQNQPQHSKELAENAARHQFVNLLQFLMEAQNQGEIRKDIDLSVLALLMVGADVFLFQIKSLLRHMPEVKFADDHQYYAQMVADILSRGIAGKGDQK